MVTKMMREAISSAEDMWGSSTTEIGTGAWAELEALQQAARVIVNHDEASGHSSDEVSQAWALLRELAKEAP